MSTLHDAEICSCRLQAERRRLEDEIDSETLKQRHADIDLDPGLYSSRSELSTACTVRDFSSYPSPSVTPIATLKSLTGCPL